VLLVQKIVNVEPMARAPAVRSLCFFFFFFFFFFSFRVSSRIACSALQCVLGQCACIFGSPGCPCNGGACNGGVNCVDGLCELSSNSLPSFVIPVAIVAGIVVLLIVVVVVVLLIRRKRANDDMGSFQTSANSGFGGTAPAFLSSSPSFYDPSPPPGSGGTGDFAHQPYGQQGGGFGVPPPPSVSNTSYRPSYDAHIYGGAPDTGSNTVGFASAPHQSYHSTGTAADQYSNIPENLSAM
jgi:hypothetical protein